jgi:2-oxoisovalerate dehydrogenase E2 component (dihydrolipoyl transacylase)
MSRYVFKMPDLGEGTVEAEVVAWHVKVGDVVKEDQIMAEVMTDKAAVEVPSPVTGKVVALNGAPGEMVPVGAELIVFETEVDHATQTETAPEPQAAGTKLAPASAPSSAAAATPDSGTGRVKALPATRRRAREAGVDLRVVAGSGPQGRITRQDVESAVGHVANGRTTPSGHVAGGYARRSGTEEIKVAGVRRVIATRMAEAKRNIPHFAYVEEVDVTELESLRRHLNARQPEGTPALTYLPFIVAAVARVVEQFPQCNAHFDADRNVVVRHRAVHAGVATQTPDGLKVPVVRHAEARGIEELAAEIRRVSEAARSGRAGREELTGSTITITSLGRLGGIVSTPIINAPEVAIIGVNKAVERPVIVDGAVAIRRMMNLSSSFDHRFVDGFDAAAMIQSLREMLEHPATIFMKG